MAAEHVDPKQANRPAVCESYPGYLVSKLDESLQQGALFDVTINIGGQSFPAHRIVLAASSGYFMGMFNRGFVESRQDEVEIHGDADSFKCLLQFAYTGKLHITETNAYDVIVMAHYLQFTHACDTALKFVRRYVRLSAEDAFKISVLDFVKPQIVKRFQYYVLGEMKDLRQSQVFLEQASDLYMAEMLQEKDLAEADDNEVVQTVVAWLLFDLDERKKHAATLISKVNLDKVTRGVLKEILYQNILRGDDCKELHDKAAELLQELKSETDKKEKSTIMKSPLGCCYNSDTTTGETHIEYMTYEGSGDSRKAVWKTHRPFTDSFPYNFHYSPETVDGVNADANPVDLSCYPSHTLIAANGIVYAKQKYCYWGVDAEITLHILYRYHFKENVWEQVFRPHAFWTDTFQVIYMDKCFYFVDTVKGIINSYSTTSKTLKLDHKPMAQCFWSGLDVVTTYMGRILVYGPYEIGGNCFLQAYDPAKDLWYQVMEDILPLYHYEEHSSIEPIIMQHNGTCYRITFHSYCSPLEGHQKLSQMPIVHELNFHVTDDILSAEVGEVVEQNRLPIKTYGAFQIDADLFVYGRGSLVYKSGQKAWNRPWDESKLKAFELYESGEPEVSNYVLCAFDSLQLANDESSANSDNETGD